MDYSILIKRILESNDFSNVTDELKLERNLLKQQQEQQQPANICCSNSSYFFVYLEQIASFIALSFDRLCKSDDKSFVKSFQRLNLSKAPIGNFKKLLINPSGTLILLVYDKSLTVVHLPAKYGKYAQYENGKTNIICKSLKFSLNNRLNIIDALWHSKSEDDLVVCLTNDNYMRIFQVSNPIHPLKEFHLSNSNLIETVTSSTDLSSGAQAKESKLVKVEIGARFDYLDQYSYPIYLLRANGQIDCLIEHENSKNFRYIGQLTVVPYSAGLDSEQNQVQEFFCLPKHPNCLVILLNNGAIYHCIFMPTTDLEDEIKNDWTGEAILYVYESIQFEEKNDLKSVRFVNDLSSNSRYFIYHSSGVHSVYLPWLQTLLFYYESKQNLDLSEIEDSEPSEINHLISTRPLTDRITECSLVGGTVLFGYGKSERMLISLNNQGKFSCLNIELAFQSEKLNRLEHLELNDKILENQKATDDLFTNYIASLLKRDADLPHIFCQSNFDMEKSELNHIIRNTLNLIKIEYIQRQKSVIAEYKKKSKILKQQETVQLETVQDLNKKLEALKVNKKKLYETCRQLNIKQETIEKQLEDVLRKLYEKRQTPRTEADLSARKELSSIKANLSDFENQIKDSKNMLMRSDQLKEQKPQFSLDERETALIKSILKNQSEKIKELVQKTDLIKQAIRK